MTTSDEIPLREYIEQRLVYMERRLDDYMAGHRREQDNTLAAMEKRLEGMNEFRQQINDSQVRFVTRPEWETAHRDLGTRLTTFEATVSKKLEDSALLLASKVSQDKLDAVYKIMWMGVGMVAILSFGVPLLISMWKNHP